MADYATEAFQNLLNSLKITPSLGDYILPWLVPFDIYGTGKRNYELDSNKY